MRKVSFDNLESRLRDQESQPVILVNWRVFHHWGGQNQELLRGFNISKRGKTAWRIQYLGDLCEDALYGDFRKRSDSEPIVVFRGQTSLMTECLK